MSDYTDTTYSEYIQQNETGTLQVESEDDKVEVKVEETLYGVNKPRRIIIKAKISHDQD